MPKSIKIYISILVLILIGIITIDANKPKPVDWSPTFSVKDKIPFGLFVLNNEIDSLFNEQKIERFGVTPYEFLDPKYSYKDSTYTTKGTIMYIDESSNIDDESAQELLYFVSHGNTAFISATNFPIKFRDTLNFNYAYSNIFADSLYFSEGKNKEFSYLKGTDNVYFTDFDSTRTEILGYQRNKTKDSVANFIRIPHVNGYFYLHTQPISFTNYYLLKKDNYKYAAQVLSHVDDATIFWYLEGSRDQIKSKMGYIFSQPALNWAWKIAIISMLIFMFFNAKRKQRIIPIVEPLKNTTVDFTKTIGNLYFQEGNHQDIINKKIKFFLEKVRNEYLVDTFDLNETFVNRLHQKTGKSKTEIENIVQLIKKYRNQIESSDKDLVIFNNALERLDI
ncbi:DUF4350 domain-containing protein [Flavobacterium jejuense]|uniref:DUF4350 domain-containing protein n=1 Tax=Flavobacterium jejuense TaxID=1544455 RepID=A0ABX0IUJ8_9FLAO|nr:DUF4350 domain-containing protein [Flavobacterium jejuense]NHN27584.1 DUF4350 domain-containing protein [Flavobacterium jejuense]